VPGRTAPESVCVIVPVQPLALVEHWLSLPSDSPVTVASEPIRASGAIPAQPGRVVDDRWQPFIATIERWAEDPEQMEVEVGDVRPSPVVLNLALEIARELHLAGGVAPTVVSAAPDGTITFERHSASFGEGTGGWRMFVLTVSDETGIEGLQVAADGTASRYDLHFESGTLR
jgi:hypothetical protein